MHAGTFTGTNAGTCETRARARRGAAAPWAWRLWLALVLGAAGCPGAAWAQWPPYLGNPPGLVRTPTPLVQEFAEAEMPLPNRPTPFVVRGRHWEGDINLPGVPLETPAAAVWARLKGLFPEPGWKVQHQAGTIVTLRYSAAGREAWATLNHADPADIRLTLVEVAQQARRHALAAPAERPERVADQDDFPYLKPLPGFKLVSGGADPTPLRALLPGHKEETVLAEGVQQRLYAGPALQVTPLQIREVYAAALQEAGWTLMPSSGDVLLAHYSRRGRDIWAQVGGGSGDLHIRVADAGLVDLAGRLRADCRAPLDGVLFDFDRATLQAESASALQRAKAAVLALAGQAFEVQGHTDNVGADDYNLKLSQARAETVRAWLVAQGVPTARLSSAGYGKARPVAPNDSPEGRARNRRVELACRK
jgi:outer membrane protein OmpA-like peptidoglycan-associated protein